LAGLFPELEQRLLEKKHKDDFFAPLFLNKLLGYLGEEERRVLDRVAIFRVAVAEDALRALGAGTGRLDKKRLADLSLLEYRANDGLYYCHRLTAGYVLDRLAENVKKDFHRAAAGYYKEIKDDKGVGYVEYYIEARWHYLQGQAWDEAAEITFALEDFLTLHGYPFQSFDLLQEIAARPLNEENQKIALHQMGILLQGFGQFDEALKYYQKSLAIKEKIGDIKGVAKSLHQVGSIYQEKGDYDAALGQYQRALKTFEDIGDIKNAALSLWGIGNVYLNKGDYDNALEQYQKALETFEKIGDIKNVAGCLHQVGRIYEEKGDYDAALEQYQKSLEIKEKIGDISGVAKSLHQVGMIYQKKGDYEVALEQYQKALKTFEEIGDIKNVASALHQVGRIYQEKGEYDAALGQYRKALEIKEKIGDLPGRAISLGQMGKLYIEREDYPTALSLCLQSLAIFQKLGSPNAEIVMGYIARIREKIGEAGFEELLASTLKELGQEKK